MDSAEQAYLFRHALLRDAAYELQLPADRAKLHELAFYLIEEAFGGRAPAPPALGMESEPGLQFHPTDVIASDLAEHARLSACAGRSGAEMASLRELYLHRGALFCSATFRTGTAVIMLKELAALWSGSRKVMALRRAGDVAHGAESRAEAEGLLNAAVQEARAISDTRQEAAALLSLATVFHGTSALPHAERHCKEALRLSHELGDARGQGRALSLMATLMHNTGRVKEAVQAYEQALALLRSAGDKFSEGVTLCNLSTVLPLIGRADEVRSVQERALELARVSGHRRLQGILLGNMAVDNHAGGRHDLAEALYAQAIIVHRETGLRGHEGGVLGNLAILYHQTGRLALADKTHMEALELITGWDAQRGFAAHTCDYALCTLAVGRVAQAASDWREGAAVLRHLGLGQVLNRVVREMRGACAKAGVPPFDEDAP